MADFVRSAFNKRGAEHELVGTTADVGKYHLTVKKVIAQGGFGFIFLAVDTDGRSYALKRIIASRENEKAVEKEVSMMKLVSGHPNIVEFVTAAVVPRKETRHGNKEYLIVSELCAAPLKTVLEPLMASKQLQHDQRLHTFHKICESVAHLHMLSPPIVHRDLKIDNVLLSATGEVKLCDFGSATSTIVRPTIDWDLAKREAAEDEIFRNTTPIFRAPEMLDLYSNMVVGPKADVWALGCLFYQLCFGVSPFEDTGKLGSLNGKYHLPEESQFAVFYPLIRGMLTVDVNSRWDIQRVLEELERIAKKLRVDLFNPLPQPLVVPDDANLTDGGSSVGELLSHAGASLHSASASLQHGGTKLFGLMKGGAGSLMKGLKETSTKVVSTVQQLSSRNLNLCYITSRIIVVDAISDAPEAITKNPLNEACELLESAHGTRFVIFLLNNRPVDESRIRGQIARCGWEPRSVPRLSQLLIFCRSLHKYLVQSSKGVAVIHCEDGKSLSALAVSAYLLYSQVFNQPKTSLVLYGRQRFPDGHHRLVLPSHNRYLEYIPRVVDQQKQSQLHCRRLRVKQLVLNSVPRFDLRRTGCKPIVEVVNGDTTVWMSADVQQLERCRSYSDTDGSIVIPLDNNVICGDIKITMYHIRTLSGVKTATPRMFGFQFHSAFVSPSSDRMVLRRNEIDSVSGNASKFTPNFAVMLHYEVMPEKDADESIAVWKKVASVPPQTPHPCFESTSEEEEIRRLFGAMDLREKDSEPAGNGRQKSQSAGFFDGAADSDGDEEEEGDSEIAANLLVESDDDDDDCEPAQVTAPAANPPQRQAEADLLGGFGDDFSAPAPAAAAPAATGALFDLAAPSGGSSAPVDDLFGGGAPAAAAPDPLLDFGLGGSAAAAPQRQAPASTGGSDLFGASTSFGDSFAPAAAPPASSSGGDAFGLDLLGGMTEPTDISFDPFSSMAAPAAAAAATRSQHAQAAAQASASTTPAAGIDLMGGPSITVNLLSGSNGGANMFGGGPRQPMAQQQQQQQPTSLNMGGLSGPSSPFQVHSPTASVSPTPRSPAGSFQPGFQPTDSAAMFASVQNKRAAMGQQPYPPAGAAADPFAQLSGFGCSAATAVTRGSTSTSGGVASRGATSAPTSLSNLSSGMRGGSSQPTSITPSPSGSGRNTPAYTSVIGGREERGMRPGMGGMGVPKKVEVGAFDDLLSQQGFQSDKASQNVSLKDMRDKDLEKTMDPVKLKIMKWTEGKRKNIRALISSLPDVLWENSGWKPIEMHLLVQPNDIKKAYRKACLCVHPDKLSGQPQEELAKALFVELNEAWTAFEQNKDMTRVA